jgi:hypothetical protein
VYQIEQRISNNGIGVTKEPLTLSIDYRCLDEEIGDALEYALATALRDSPHQPVSRLLLSILMSRTFDMLEAADYELVGLFGEIQVPSFVSMRWEEILKALPPSDREPLLCWLRQWHDVRKPSFQAASMSGADRHSRRTSSFAFSQLLPRQ